MSDELLYRVMDAIDGVPPISVRLNKMRKTGPKWEVVSVPADADPQVLVRCWTAEVAEDERETYLLEAQARAAIKVIQDAALTSSTAGRTS